MKHRKEKKHMKKCFDVRIDAHLNSPDDAILPYVICNRCLDYMWLGVPNAPVNTVFDIESCEVCNRNAFSCECACTCTDKECEENHVIIIPARK
jgi:hypothetical protein